MRRAPSSHQDLIGREWERRRIRDLLAGLATGRGGAVVVTGADGIGKTALLRDAADQAGRINGDGGGPPIQIAQVTGTVAEQDWPYAGLHLVLSALSGAAGGGIPGTWSTSSLLGSHTAGGGYEAAREVQELISRVTRPVLLLVDDAHRLDAPSQEVLGFVARRLHAIPVAMVLASGEEPSADHLTGLPSVRLDELEPADAVALLERTAGPRLAHGVATQLVTRIGGNPRALLDVLERVPETQLIGQVELDRDLPPSPVLQSLHLPELDQLDDEQRFALLVATGSEDGRLAPVVNAVGRSDDSLADWLIAEYIVPSDSRFTLRRPAVRSVIWQAASPSERARAHEALAAAYAGSDRVQQLWHLAQARHADEELAAELELTARALLDRGELERSTMLATEAVRLTATRTGPADRIVLAGRLAVLTGRLSEAVNLAQERFKRDVTAAERADLALVELRARSIAGGDVATGLVTRHVAELAGTDPDRAARLALTAAAELAGRMEEAEAARLLAVSEQFVADANRMTASMHGRTAALVASVSGQLQRAVELVAADTSAAAAAPQLVPGTDDVAPDVFAEAGIAIQGAAALAAAERFDPARRLLDVVTADGRMAASPVLLGAAYSVLSGLELRAGRIGAARGAVEAWDRVVSGGTFRAVAPPHIVRIHALAGDDEAAWAWRRRAMDGARRHGDSWQSAMVQADTGALLLLLGRLDEALISLDHARRHALQHTDPAVMAVEPDFIEVCLRLGETDRAASALAEFEARATQVPTSWATHALRRCRALVREGEDAVSLLVEAAGDAASPAEVARTQLCLAEWLRRLGRRSESRKWLQQAHSLAHQAGALALVARAEEELGAAANGPFDAVEQLGNLTEAEWRIAALVAAGRRNKEIAAELFVSIRTVEVHLSRIFRKVGVRSRIELTSAVIAAGRRTT